MNGAVTRWRIISGTHMFAGLEVDTLSAGLDLLAAVTGPRVCHRAGSASAFGRVEAIWW